MCLGIPGRVVGVADDAASVARVEVGGLVRDIDLSLLDDGPPAVGEWVVVHLGFALERMTEAEAAEALAAEAQASLPA